MNLTLEFLAKTTTFMFRDDQIITTYRLARGLDYKKLETNRYNSEVSRRFCKSNKQ